MTARRGVWLFVLLLTLVGSVVLFSALAVRGRRSAPASPVVLVWDLPDELDETAPVVHRLGYVLRRPRPSLIDVVQGLERAAADDQVRGLVLHVADLDWGWGKLGEIRDAVSRVRAAGKPVYAVMESGGDAEYFLASAADVVATLPAAVLYVDGLAATAMFMRGTLDKLDVRPNFAYAGQYKSAVEFYEREGLSPSAREALETVVGRTFSMLVDTIAAARGISPETAERIIDEGPFDAQLARERGLVDTVAHAIDIDSLAVQRAPEGTQLLGFSEYVSHPGSRASGKVAYVVAAGTIAPGRNRYSAGDGAILGSETMIDVLREVADRPSIKAVVLRIDSPGGDALATDEIWHEVERLSDAKPVVVSMSDLAASGGYYVAAPARTIVAEPATLTGSIGVYGGKLNLIGLWRKLGLNVEVVSRGQHAQILSAFRDFTPEEAQRYQKQIETTYRRFLTRVSEGRDLSMAEADSAARGRLWTGMEALSLGLVDTLGGIRTAFELALESADLPRDVPLVVERYPKIRRSFLDRLVESWFADENDQDSYLRVLSPVMRAWIVAAQFPAGRALTVTPWSVTIR